MMFNLAQKRLNIVMSAITAAHCSFNLTLDYVKERKVFGQTIGEFQNTRFIMAELATEIKIGQTFVDSCVMAHNRKELTSEEAAMAKWWTTELQKK